MHSFSSYTTLFCKILFLLVMAVFAGSGAAAETASPFNRSDVLFSPRFDRGELVFEKAEAFHATKFVWSYITDEEMIARAQREGYDFSGTLNSMLDDWPEKGQKKRGRLLDIEGKPVTAPWMVDWEAWWGCVNSPEWMETYLGHAKAGIDRGITHFQMDDPGMNAARLGCGACFCEHCMEGFNRYLQQKDSRVLRDAGIDSLDGFNYKSHVLENNNNTLREWFREFQTQSVTDFYKVVRKELDEYAGERITLSSNNYAGRFSWPHNLFELGLAELPERNSDPGTIYEILSEAKSLGRQQAFTLVSEDVSLTRNVLATTYALGGHLIVPWDVYMGSAEPRYFGQPEQYSDLYGFIRANSELFDGFVKHATAGAGLPDSEEIDLAGTEDIVAVMRRHKEKNQSLVLIHLVDWSDAPEPFTLSLDTASFFDGEPVKIRLLTPPPYSQQLHKEAAESGDYSKLSEESFTAAGFKTQLNLPALSPWGILVVELQ